MAKTTEMKLNEDILFYAFRYALGRSTYAVNDVATAIEENWSALHPNTKSTIQKEIETAIISNNFGMGMDKQSWEKILKLEL